VICILHASSIVILAANFLDLPELYFCLILIELILKLFTTKFIIRHQAKLFFIAVWGHVTILDLFYVTYAGPIFFIAESLKPFTLFIHLIVASLTLAFYYLLINTMTRFSRNKKIKQSISSNNISKNSSS